MSDIHIHRKHQLGLPAVRTMAMNWARQAEEKYDMECTYEEGELQDSLCFERSGIKGTLDVGPDALDFHAKLGFLISAFKERIETELQHQLDGLLETSETEVEAVTADAPDRPGDTDGSGNAQISASPAKKRAARGAASKP